MQDDSISISTPMFVKSLPVYILSNTRYYCRFQYSIDKKNPHTHTHIMQYCLNVPKFTDYTKDIILLIYPKCNQYLQQIDNLELIKVKWNLQIHVGTG